MMESVIHVSYLRLLRTIACIQAVEYILGSRQVEVTKQNQNSLHIGHLFLYRVWTLGVAQIVVAGTEDCFTFRTAFWIWIKDALRFEQSDIGRETAGDRNTSDIKNNNCSVIVVLLSFTDKGTYNSDNRYTWYLSSREVLTLFYSLLVPRRSISVDSVVLIIELALLI